VVRYSLAGDKRLSRKETHQRAVAALREVALPDAERLLKNYPFQLSGGMRQRVCIAMAVAGSRELIIADEPGTSLDVSIQDQILRLLRRLVEEKNTSVILITHTLGVVREIADRVYVMYAGKMVEVATTEELFSRPLHPYTLGLMKAVPKLTGGGIADGIPGRIPNHLDVGGFHPGDLSHFCPDSFADEGVRRASACGEGHDDVDVVVVDLHVIDQAEIQNIDRDFRVIAIPQHLVDLFLCDHEKPLAAYAAELDSI